MYWGLVFLAVSLLALPFAMGDSLAGGPTAVILVAVFGILSLTFFVYGREKRQQPPRARGKGRAAPRRSGRVAQRDHA